MVGVDLKLAIISALRFVKRFDTAELLLVEVVWIILEWKLLLLNKVTDYLVFSNYYETLYSDYNKYIIQSYIIPWKFWQLHSSTLHNIWWFMKSNSVVTKNNICWQALKCFLHFPYVDESIKIV